MCTLHGHRCPEVLCPNPLLPRGHCCPLCGAVLQLQYGMAFRISSLQGAVNNLQLSQVVLEIGGTFQIDHWLHQSDQWSVVIGSGISYNYLLVMPTLYIFYVHIWGCTPNLTVIFCYKVLASRLNQPILFTVVDHRPITTLRSIVEAMLLQYVSLPDTVDQDLTNMFYSLILLWFLIIMIIIIIKVSNSINSRLYVSDTQYSYIQFIFDCFYILCNIPNRAWDS